MRFGFLLGIIVSPIVLGMIFFGMFMPIAFFLRLKGRDELRLKFNNKSSHWISRSKQIESTLQTAILIKANIMEVLKELWAFLRVRKKLWLAPIIIVMLILGGLLILAQGSVVAPFIYTLF